MLSDHELKTLRELTPVAGLELEDAESRTGSEYSTEASAAGPEASAGRTWFRARA
jgi:hypothetical protein